MPRIDAMKRSACIEVSQMALAHVKAYWAEMDATTVAAQGSAIGRVAAEHNFEEVLDGAHLIEASARRILCLSDMYSHCKHNVFMKFIKAVFILFPESNMMPPVRPFMYTCV